MFWQNKIGVKIDILNGSVLVCKIEIKSFCPEILKKIKCYRLANSYLESTHCYFTRLKPKRKGPFYFCLPALHC